MSAYTAIYVPAYSRCAWLFTIASCMIPAHCNFPWMDTHTENIAQQQTGIIYANPGVNRNSQRT